MDISVVPTPLLLQCYSHCAGSVAFATYEWINFLEMEFLGLHGCFFSSLDRYFQIALQTGWTGLYFHQQKLNALCVSICRMWECAHGVTAFWGDGLSFYEILRAV